MDNLFGAGGAGGGGPEEWFRSLPPITRIWLGSTVIVTGMANLDFVKWADLALARWEDVLGNGVSGKLEAWRLITCFLYAGKFGFNAIIGLHLMTQISNRYEKMGPICTRRIYIPPPNNDRTNNNENDDTQQRQQQQQRQRNINPNHSPYYPRGESPDYAFALLFGMVGILMTQFLLLPYLPSSLSSQRHIFFHRHLTQYVVYIWSKQHAHHRVNLFGFPMEAAYLPYAYLIIGYALNNGQVLPIDNLHGMFVGHVYYYLACVVPSVLGGGRAVLATPMFLVDLCNWLEGRNVIGFGRGGEDEPVLADVDGVIGG